MPDLTNLDSKIAIVGAGIGGLALALALARQGAKHLHLFERRADAQEFGAGLQVGPNAVRLLDQLGLSEQLHAISARSPIGRMIEGRSGRKLAELPMDVHAMQAYGSHSYQLLRSDLHRLLSDELTAALGHNPVQLDRELVGMSFDGKPRIEFSDGTEEQADLIVGADGVESKMRSLIFDDARTSYSGYFTWRGLVDADSSPELGKTVDGLCVWVGEGKHLIAYPLHEGKLINLVGISESAHWQSKSGMEERPVSDWLDDYRGWNKQALGLIERSVSCQKWSLRTMPELDCWHRGSVGLLGDAAHPMLPSLAQGAAQAIEDAVCLAGLISQGGRTADELFAGYFQLRFHRVHRVQKASHWNLRFFHRPDNMITRVQNCGMRIAGGVTSKIIAGKYRWLYNR